MAQFEYDVFLSHASADKSTVRELAEQLNGDGLRVWFDEWEIQPGDSIPLSIERGLESSRTLLLIMSHAAFSSEWVTLERHTAQFSDPTNKTRRLIPLRLDNSEIKDSLKQLAYVDWRQQAESEYQRLLKCCRPPDKHDRWGRETVRNLRRILSSSQRSFAHLRDKEKFSFTDAEFTELVDDFPEYFRHQGIKPNRDGVRLATASELNSTRQRLEVTFNSVTAPYLNETDLMRMYRVGLRICNQTQLEPCASVVIQNLRCTTPKADTQRKVSQLQSVPLMIMGERGNPPATSHSIRLNKVEYFDFLKRHYRESFSDRLHVCHAVSVERFEPARHSRHSNNGIYDGAAYVRTPEDAIPARATIGLQQTWLTYRCTISAYGQVSQSDSAEFEFGVKDGQLWCRKVTTGD